MSEAAGSYSNSLICPSDLLVLTEKQLLSPTPLIRVEITLPSFSIIHFTSVISRPNSIRQFYLMQFPGFVEVSRCRGVETRTVFVHSEAVALFTDAFLI